eukprot:CAMPEP_0113605546 /NCGR_PEP_ID=MMETSP0017_2-20120614/2384_1 /TAXON_ID=2856 /ORGANISM="Cylindrotheca closterium" /LENGTH=190 /DNA_ID=CAMNT_0000514041 /DNA_START=1 /DNA_END=570 /DNA_ORIENTATION=- /assembly_acc=CAM_ASM_000147
MPSKDQGGHHKIIADHNARNTTTIAMTRRRRVSFSATVEKCEPQILDKSSYSDYLNCWYSCREHKGFKESVRELAELLETNPNLKTSRTQSTIFRGIERHTSTEKVRIREKREMSYSIVQSLQDRSSNQMARMLLSHSDECLLESYNRALEDENQCRDVPSYSKFKASTNKRAEVASPLTSPRSKPRYIS